MDFRHYKSDTGSNVQIGTIRNIKIVFTSILRFLRLYAVIPACLSLLTSFVSAQAILVVSKGSLQHNFGDVERRTDLPYKVQLKNIGNKEAIFKKVKRSCGRCTALQFSRMTIPPGENVIISTKLFSGDQRGKQTRKYFIQTNDASTSNPLEIKTEWNVVPFLGCYPTEIRFGTKSFKSTFKSNITLDTEGLGQFVKVTSIRSRSKHVRADKTTRTLNGNKIIIPISVLPTAPVGELRSSILINTDFRKEPKISVPISGTIQGAFGLKQKYLSFGAVPEGIRLQKDVKITALTNGPESLTGLEFDKGMLSCELTKAKGSGYVLKVDLLPSLKVGTHKSIITMKTNCPVQPFIELPVLAVVRKYDNTP